MDSRPWDAISFTFQGGIIALFDVNKAATLRVHGHHRGRDAHLQIMAQSHWRLLGRPLHFARIIAYQETKTSLDMHEMKKGKGVKYSIHDRFVEAQPNSLQLEGGKNDIFVPSREAARVKINSFLPPES